MLLRPTALMTPTVTVSLRPKGLPMAMTQSPISILAESPSGSTGKLSPSILIRATSESGSVPISLALLNVRPSFSSTVILSTSPTT